LDAEQRRCPALGGYEFIGGHRLGGGDVDRVDGGQAIVYGRLLCERNERRRDVTPMGDRVEEALVKRFLGGLLVKGGLGNDFETEKVACDELAVGIYQHRHRRLGQRLAASSGPDENIGVDERSNGCHALLGRGFVAAAGGFFLVERVFVEQSGAAGDDLGAQRAEIAT
jgi:hypothetical protein